jgi:multiple sugar transport system permease protein
MKHSRAFIAAQLTAKSVWIILIKIVLPMQGPMLAVVAINSALGSWNDWMTPFLYINKTSESTLTAWLGTMASQLQSFGVRNYPQGIASVGIKG